MRTINIDGIEYVAREDVPAPKYRIVRATRGYRDYIYVGVVSVDDSGDYRIAPGGACVRQYRDRGLTGAASDPSLTTLDRCATGVVIPGSAVVDIIDCGPAWDDVL